MRKGGDRRGNRSVSNVASIQSLRALRERLLGESRVRCHLKLSDQCVGVLDISTITPDRIVRDGSYERGNVQPACVPCQNTQGGLARHGLLDHHYLLAQLAATREADQKDRERYLLGRHT